MSSEAVETALLECGASSITFSDRGDEPVLEPRPGEFKLWRDTLVRALFEDTHDAAAALAALAARLGEHITATARVRAVRDQIWERAWMRDWHPMRFGRRLWVCPHEAAPPSDPRAVVVRLDPGLAFGTGTHPTTALCLQFLDALPLAGRSVIDYGCGSGILGIAALKLGAKHVDAVDIDPQALLATRDNARRNGVAAQLATHAAQPDTDAAQSDTDAAPLYTDAVAAALEPASCVLANILAGPLVELAPRLTRLCAPQADLILSGLLKSQAFEVKAAYGGAFDIVQVVGREDWCCIHARRST